MLDKMDPILRSTVGQMLFAAVVLVIALAIDGYIEARKRKRMNKWRGKK